MEYMYGYASLVWMYHHGYGVPVDYVKNITNCRKAIDEEKNDRNGFAINEIKLMYQDGSGVSKSYKITMGYFQKAVRLNSSDAYSSMGDVYKYGSGNVDVDLKKAVDWYTKSAKKCCHYGELSLTKMHYKGLGVCNDYEHALYWFSASLRNRKQEAKLYVN